MMLAQLRYILELEKMTIAFNIFYLAPMHQEYTYDEVLASHMIIIAAY